MCQGSRPIQDYLAEFCRNAVRVQDWPKAMKVRFCRVGLNTHLVKKAVFQDDPCTLLGWIQLTCKVENEVQIVKLIYQQHQAGVWREPWRPTERSMKKAPGRAPLATAERHCHLK